MGTRGQSAVRLSPTRPVALTSRKMVEPVIGIKQLISTPHDYQPDKEFKSDPMGNNPIYTVVDEDDQKWLCKWTNNWSGRTESEYNCYLVDRFLGIGRVPEVVAATPKYMRQHHLIYSMEEAQRAGLSFSGVGDDKLARIPVFIKWEDGTVQSEHPVIKKSKDWHRKERMMMKMFDHLICDPDRHDGNFMVTKDETYKWIDNAMSMNFTFSKYSKRDLRAEQDGFEYATDELMAYYRYKDVKKMMDRFATITDAEINNLCEKMVAPVGFRRKYSEYLKSCRDIVRDRVGHQG